jgi:SWIM zinc finger
MVTRHNIIYSIAAAQRILGIKSGVYEIRVWAWVVLVRGLNFCRFMSKKAFLKHFADRRREEGKNIDLVIDDQDASHFTALGKSNFYQLHTQDDRITCTCEDYKNQFSFFKGKGLCKHGYAVLSHIGYESLSDYVQRDRTYEKVDISQAPVRIPERGERTSRGRSID